MGFTLQESHDDRCRNIIRKICHHLERTSFEDTVYITFKDILVYNLYVIILRKGFTKYRDKLLIYLDCHNTSCCFGQILGKSSYSRTYLKHIILRTYLGSSDYLLDNMAVYKKVLSKGFLKTEVVLLYYLYCLFRIT